MINYKNTLKCVGQRNGGSVVSKLISDFKGKVVNYNSHITYFVILHSRLSLNLQYSSDYKTTIQN